MANVWKSAVTVGMTKHLTDDERANLAQELDDAVMDICQSYEIGA
jgi:hypothetical protein